MLSRNNFSEVRKFGKLLWYDPNPTDNEPIDLSDLTILVNLQLTSKTRSVILVNSTDNTIITTNNGEKTVINVDFFNGSENTGKGSPRALTTNYTDIQSLQGNIGDDYEALGIESINITFNSSYAPMIKIKFIDIRGAAMFSNGGKGKYKFFFEMPYPLFNLTIKGYYGKPVNYCLHLLKFNASFNAQTGNFEIDCDFIGYTYALLADMLMGLVRASVTTERGKGVFASIKSEYTNQDSIITIDELVKRVSNVKDEIDKIKQSENSEKIGNIESTKNKIEELKTRIISFLEECSNSATLFTKTYSNGVLVISEKNVDKQSNEYRKNVRDKWINEIKKNGSSGYVDINSTDANEQIIASELDYKKDDENYFLTYWSQVDKLSVNTIKKDETELRTKLKAGYFAGDKLEYAVDLLKNLDYGNTDYVTIIDLSRGIKACDNALTALDTMKDAETNA